MTLDFSKQSQKYIEDLQQLSGTNTKAELFKQALNVFDFVVNELTDGSKFVVVKHDNSEKEVVFPLMIPRRNNNAK